MHDKEDLRVASGDAGVRLRRAGQRETLEELGQEPEHVIDVAEQRAIRIYGHLTGTFEVPVRKLQIGSVNQKALDLFKSLWVEAWITGLLLEADGIPVFSFSELSEGVRNVDTLSEERGVQGVFEHAGIEPEAAMSLSLRMGTREQSALRAAKSPIPRDTATEITALSAIWQDGIVAARLTLLLHERTN